MFYYLLYNSSFSFIVDNRLFSTVLYGSILYILTHAILNYCKIELLEIINNYFWFIFVLDVISLAYGVYLSPSNPASNQTASNQSAGSLSEYPESQTNLDVSFNLLKNKINTIGTYFHRKNDISITDNIPIPTPRQPLRIQTSSPPVQNAQHHSQNTNPTQQYSHHSQQKQNTTINNQSTSFSTPITALRDLEPPPSRNTSVSHIPDPIITSSDGIYNDNSVESIAGSDVGSIMDLDDFEKSL